MEEQFDFYPPKPVLPKKEEKSGWSMTVLSLVLFVASFMILFADRVQFLVFLIIVLFIHEMGHFLFMKYFNYKNVKMMFVPLMGAFVQGVKKIYSQKESFCNSRWTRTRNMFRYYWQYFCNSNAN